MADIAEWKKYESVYTFDQDGYGVRDYQPRKLRKGRATEVLTMPVAKKRRAVDAELLRIAIQARRAADEEAPITAKRPSVSRWIPISLDILALVAFATVLTAFFVFLLELSAGRPAFLVPSFSAMFIFAIVGIVSFKLKGAVRRFQQGET
ncbi:MAG: hypothetical protein AAFX45_10700 [Pseudomonadota bacterium]